MNDFVYSIEFAKQLEMFNNDIIGKLETSIKEVNALKNDDNRLFTKGQVQYWEHVIAGLKWTITIANQKAGVK
jgi:hypothetical protein